MRCFIRDAYVKKLRGADRKIVSHYDATFAVADPNPESASARGPDPILDGFIRAYGSAFVGYARVGFKTEITYNLLASEVAGNASPALKSIRRLRSKGDASARSPRAALRGPFDGEPFRSTAESGELCKSRAARRLAS